MSRTWKFLVIASLLSSAASLLYAYAAAHPNPYNREHYELEQLKSDMKQMKQEIADLRESLAARKR